MRLYSLLLKSIVSKLRIAFMVFGGAACVVFAGLIKPDDSVDLRIVISLGFLLLLPVVALIFGTAVLGELNEESTLHYIWMRPVARFKLALTAVAAAATPTALIVIPTFALLAFVAGGDYDAVFAAIGGAAVGSLAYVAFFTFLGALFKRALIFGLIYIFLWEALIASNVEQISRVSIGLYPRDVFVSVVPLPEISPLYSSTMGIIVSAGIGLAYVWLTSFRLRRMDID